MTTYPIRRQKPVYRFRYAGTHSKAIRRTVLVTDTGKTFVRGYELRSGNNTNTVATAPIKSFTKDKIKNLSRFSLLNLVTEGA